MFYIQRPKRPMSDVATSYVCRCPTSVLLLTSDVGRTDVGRIEDVGRRTYSRRTDIEHIENTESRGNSAKILLCGSGANYH